MISLMPFRLHTDLYRDPVQFGSGVCNHMRHLHATEVANTIAVHVIDIDGHTHKIGRAHTFASAPVAKGTYAALAPDCGAVT